MLLLPARLLVPAPAAIAISETMTGQPIGRVSAHRYPRGLQANQCQESEYCLEFSVLPLAAPARMFPCGDTCVRQVANDTSRRMPYRVCVLSS